MTETVGPNDAVPVRTARYRRRRGRPPGINAARTLAAAAELERILEPGCDLVHTRRLGWSLRVWDAWVRADASGGEPRVGWVEIDSAPDGQLGALLLRHQKADLQAKL